MVLPHLSASQIQTFGNCKRLWSFEKLCGIKGPERSFQTFGKDVHRGLEEWELLGLATGTSEDVYRRIQKAIEVGGLMRGTALTEAEIRFPLYEGGPDLLGYIDRLEPGEMDENGDAVVTVLDYKTTSNLRYAKTPTELEENVQMILYAYFVFRYLPQLRAVAAKQGRLEAWEATFGAGVDKVKLSHLCILSKGAAKAQRIDTVVDWVKVAKEYAKIEATGREMVQLAADVPNTNGLCTPEHALALVPGNGEFCSAYGGCAHRDKCPEAKSFVSLGALFRKHEDKGDPLMASSMDDLKERLAKKMNAAPPADASAQTAPVEQTAQEPEKTQDAAPAVATGIVPPDAPPRTSTIEEVAAASAAPAKKGKAKKPAPVPPADTAPEAPAVLPGAHGAPKPEPTRGAGSIYINSRAYKGEDASADVTAWTTWMKGILDDLHAQLKVLDYRLVEFGKGRGALNAFLRDRLSTAPAVCHVSTMHPEAQDFLAIAIPLAEKVVGQ